MFYARINKIKVFNNREGFLGLFNRAEMRIYGYATALPPTVGADPQVSPVRVVPNLLSDLAGLPDEAARLQKLQDAVESEINRFAQSATLEINGVKDNQSLLFGDSGLVVFQSDTIPAWLDLQLWVIESDEDVRRFALDAGQVIDSDAFTKLFAVVETALTVANPVLSGAIAIGSVVANLLRQKLLTNKDDLVGYWQATLNRAEHYPHGARDRQAVPDTTGNIQVDYTLFGFENSIEEASRQPDGLSADAGKTPVTPVQEETGKEAEFVRLVYPAAQRLYESVDGLHPLFVTAQAALETGWKIRTAGNNIFGITKGASWTGSVNLLPTFEIFSTSDRQFTPPEKVISVEQLAPDKYRYNVYREFRAYDSLEDSLADHLSLLKGPLYSAAWPYRHDPREYARCIAGTYATSPDYAKTLVAVIDRVEKMTNLLITIY
ncbi:MAG: glucosaminidase domain-containing protein [Tannerella sp.]|jgi:flagellar protein FlgJ|nr:glucosaminidase domain-containing protein [Tannerella sp.]